jgi:hypothetical protein
MKTSLKNKSRLLFRSLVIILLIFSITFGYLSWDFSKDLNQKNSELEIINSEMSQIQIKLENSENKIQTIKEFEIYMSDYTDVVLRLNSAIEDWDTLEDYTTCENYYEKYEEIHKEFNENENEKLDFLESISSGSEECDSEIKSYASMIPKVVSTRKDYIADAKNMCYGYHKVEWSYSWEELYLSPWEKTGASMSNDEEKIGDIFSKAKIACLTI